MDGSTSTSETLLHRRRTACGTKGRKVILLNTSTSSSCFHPAASTYSLTSNTNQRTHCPKTEASNMRTAGILLLSATAVASKGFHKNNVADVDQFPPSVDALRAEAARWDDIGIGAPGDLINCTVGGTPCEAAYSAIGVGCCPYENAVCCPSKQTCCPADHTCVDEGYLTTCVPTAGGSNSSGLSVCKSGPNVPLSKTLPNVLIIGDSVSIGYVLEK